jgi:3-oxoacyl-[acyl-carrier protein] reductase
MPHSAGRTALWSSKNMSKTITITGASSEIGRAIVRYLDATCDRFILQCHAHHAQLEEATRRLATPSEIVKADFSDDAELSDFCSRIEKSDVLINAAAVTKTEILPAVPDDDIRAMIRVNIWSLIKICQSVLPYMFSRRAGVIINLSSVAASRGNRGQTVYGGTKGFVESFSRSLASETGSRHIRVNCIAPGPIDAGSLKSVLEYAGDEIRASLLSRRLGTPEDVASLVRYLCSNESEFIMGQVIGIDGGFMRGV